MNPKNEWTAPVTQRTRALYQETAQLTAEVFGVNWGGGLYFNYVFTAVWVAYSSTR